MTFKENCPDLRNTRVTDIIAEFKEYGVSVEVYDPWVDPEEAKNEYQIDLVSNLEKRKYSGIVIAVAHQQFTEMTINDLRDLCIEKSVIYDVKNLFPRDQVDGCL